MPRERILEKQRFFQNVQKHTFLKGRYDAITSVGIPLALAATSLFLIVYLPFLLLVLFNTYIKPDMLPAYFFYFLILWSFDWLNLKY